MAIVRRNSTLKRTSVECILQDSFGVLFPSKGQDYEGKSYNIYDHWSTVMPDPKKTACQMNMFRKLLSQRASLNWSKRILGCCGTVHDLSALQQPEIFFDESKLRRHNTWRNFEQRWRNIKQELGVSRMDDTKPKQVITKTGTEIWARSIQGVPKWETLLEGHLAALYRLETRSNIAVACIQGGTNA